jgi:chaperonin GroES
MATERNPFDKIPMGKLSIEIESSTGVDEDGNEAFMEVDPEDGGVIVEFKPPKDERSKVQQKEEPEEFYRNLADDMDDDLLEDIAYKVIENFEADKDSRSEWESMFERGFDLLGLKLEEASEPFEGACTAVHPILIESAVKFQSKATQELFPPAGPVKSQIIGDKTEEKEAQAERVKAFMNYQITDQMGEYFDEFERMLFHLPLIGSAFKKTYFDKSLNRPVSEFVPIDQFYISYYATDLRRADRYTHVIYRSPIEMQRDTVAGMYADVDLPEASMPDQSAMAQKMDTILGLSPSSQHDPQYVLLEQHCYLDLPEPFQENDGLSLPYIVTIDYKSRQVLSVRRNYDIKDKRREKKIFFTHYRFVPGFGFYGLGLIHFLGNLTMTATAAMRGLVDAGQFANLPGGFKAKGLRIVGDNDPIAPGEWKEVEAVGNDLSKMIIPLPYKEPSQTLFQMLGFVSNAAQKFADSTEQLSLMELVMVL